jgi:DNA-binding FrmR family transcriptional regulator
MSCCTPTGYRTIFGARTVERDARRYARKGLVASARWVFERLHTADIKGRTVLEIGGGIGDLQIELLEAGAVRVTNVELIDTYEGVAGTLIADRGLEQRIDRRIGDFALDADAAPTADIVVMHRVICCYPDADTLVAAACEHSRDRVAITVPRESWWVRLGFATVNAWFRVRRIAFRAYVHPIAPMTQLAAAHGFHQTARQQSLVWTSLILARQPADASDVAAGGERMISGERYCIDILTQISARTALDSIALKLLEGHVGSCVATALASGDQEAAAAKSRELIQAVERFARARR